MSKKVILKANDIAKILSSAKFNPNKDTMMQIILDNGNPEYYMRKAVDMIRETISNPNASNNQEKLTFAIRLLVITKAQMPNGTSQILGSIGA